MNYTTVSLDIYSRENNESRGAPIFVTESVVVGGMVELCLLHPAVKSFQYYRTLFSPALGSP